MSEKEYFFFKNKKSGFSSLSLNLNQKILLHETLQINQDLLLNVIVCLRESNHAAFENVPTNALYLKEKPNILNTDSALKSDIYFICVNRLDETVKTWKLECSSIVSFLKLSKIYDSEKPLPSKSLQESVRFNVNLISHDGSFITYHCKLLFM